MGDEGWSERLLELRRSVGDQPPTLGELRALTELLADALRRARCEIVTAEPGDRLERELRGIEVALRQAITSIESYRDVRDEDEVARLLP
jgi:hypothetical protein